MQKKKSGVKKCLEICAIKGGGVGRLMANAILNFHFDYLHPSLMRIHGLAAGQLEFHFISGQNAQELNHNQDVKFSWTARQN